MAIAAQVTDAPEVGGDVVHPKGCRQQHLLGFVAGGEGDPAALLLQLPGGLQARAGDGQLHPDAIGRDRRQGSSAAHQIRPPGLQMQLLHTHRQGPLAQGPEVLQGAGLARTFQQRRVGRHPAKEPRGQPLLPGAGVGRVQQQMQCHRSQGLSPSWLHCRRDPLCCKVSGSPRGRAVW